MKTKPHTYDGEKIAITYDLKRCIHAGECVKGLPGVFAPDRKPWVDPDAADPDQIMAVIGRCPSGALHAERKDGGAGEAAPEGNTATVVPDGPLYLRGDLAVTLPDGTVIRDTRMALCRCGASKIKPFCDNSHIEAKFTDSGAVGTFGGQPAEGAGPMTLTPLPKGPVRAEGPLSVQDTGAGQTVGCGKVSLCRCGESNNKPFCDGSHRGIGFTGD